MKRFEMKLFGLKLVLPNPKFRRALIHIHDLHHVLNNQDTSWKGEGFISGWEISTGLWKHVPICFFSLWAMGYSLWIHPKAVFLGYKKGINNIGVIDLKLPKSAFMRMELSKLIQLTEKKKTQSMGILNWSAFISWSIVSQLIFLGPLFLFVWIMFSWL